jgi:hypothetical protein
MKKVYLLLFLGFVLTIHSAFGQSAKDSISVIKTGETIFMMHGLKLTFQQLSEVTKSNPETSGEMNAARGNKEIATILGIAGGFMIGWPLGTLIGGGEPNWIIGGAGLGLALFSIPFTIAFNKHCEKAIHIYNRGLNHSALKTTELRIGFCRNGIGIHLNF